MKIVSRFKDYYDFAAGYDTDPRKVYVREKKLLAEPRELDADADRAVSELYHYTCQKERYFKGTVFFCDNYYDYLYDTKTSIYYYQYESIPAEIIKTFDTEGWNLDYLFRHRNRLIYKSLPWQTGIYRQPNKMVGSPVLFSYLRENRFVEYVKDSCLNDIKFGTVKSPQEAYQELYNWIEFKEPETDAEPTNMNRFESKGFDKKTSFRKIK